MSLFSRLFGHRSLEDFFTEIFAFLLADSDDLLRDWLRENGMTRLAQFTHATVATQASFDAIVEQTSGNRPDVVITLFDNRGRRGVVFLESKLGAREGYRQLRGYAEVLASDDDLEERWLVYVTRDFDPKDSEEIVRGLSRSVEFRQLRWSDLYHSLSKRSNDRLVREVKQFMREQGMAQRNQFQALDLLALGHLPRAVTMMDATLTGEVSVRLAKVLDGGRRSSPSMAQLQYHGRYILIPQSASGILYMVGYFLNRDDGLDYPRIGARVELIPGKERRAELVQSMRKFCEAYSEWTVDPGLSDPKTWGGITVMRDLRDYLKLGDHVKAIEAEFLAWIDAIERMRSDYEIK